jgi:signal peptidase II
MKPITKRILVVLGIVLLSVILDQWTKELARQFLQGEADQQILGDFFRLTFVENKGAFLSLGAELGEGLRYLLLNIFPSILLVVLLFYTIRGKDMGWWQIVALSFIIGGGLSNIYDRLLYGKVVDFMHMKALGLQTGIFNVADVSIMIGMFMMLPLMFKKPESKGATEDDTDTTVATEVAAAAEEATPRPERPGDESS